MITEKTAREWARQFRIEVYGTFQRCADAMFELIDALVSNTWARSPAELSLSPFFRRQYASLYDGLDAWDYDATALDEVLLGIGLWTRHRARVGLRLLWRTGRTCTIRTRWGTTSLLHRA